MNLGKPPPGRHRESLPALGSVRLPPPRFEIWAWQQQARCRGLPAHVFFPEGLRGADLNRLEDRAKRICTECPVVTQCREHALSTLELWGVWGAMTSRERAEQLYAAPISE
jgi:WhiB family redox-sensing transcriptional regulator